MDGQQPKRKFINEAFLRTKPLPDRRRLLEEQRICVWRVRLIDKCRAYEEAMRVLMLVPGPEVTQGGGRKLNHVIANIDIAPTFLKAARLQAPKNLHGISFLP